MDKKVLGKIMKCLRLSASSEPHEAAAALQAEVEVAQEGLALFGGSAGGVEGDEAFEDFFVGQIRGPAVSVGDGGIEFVVEVPDDAGRPPLAMGLLVDAVYEVLIDGRWVAAETLCASAPAACRALISACNPYSQPLADVGTVEWPAHARLLASASRKDQS